MRAELKIAGRMLAEIRSDLKRPHTFAHERVGFLTAGIVAPPSGGLLLLSREYAPVDDEDYLDEPGVGAMIGSDGMRKGLQMAYRARSALLHVHTHGGRGIPRFSGIDIRESRKFVPSFFNAIPQSPHGAVVLSNDSASGLLWLGPDRSPIAVTGFVRVGVPLQRFGGLQ